jgi:hypothetical protein
MRQLFFHDELTTSDDDKIAVCRRNNYLPAGRRSVERRAARRFVLGLLI